MWDHGAAHVKDEIDGPLTQPCTIHPIKSAGSFEYLWANYGASTWSPARNVSTKAQAAQVAQAAHKALDLSLLLRQEGIVLPEGHRISTVERVWRLPSSPFTASPLCMHPRRPSAQWGVRHPNTITF